MTQSKKQTKIPLRKTCSLARFGYSLDSNHLTRQQSLRKAVKAYGSRYVIQKLSVLRTYRKSRNTTWKRKQYAALDKDIAYTQLYRDAMSNAARAKDLARSRAYSSLKPSNKMYC